MLIGTLLLDNGEEQWFILHIRRLDANTPVVFSNGKSVLNIRRLLLIKLLEESSLSNDIHPDVLVETRQLLLALRLLRGVPTEEGPRFDVIGC